MKESFDNKVAFVTGAGSGIGLVTARAFAEAGAAVVLADKHEKEVRPAAEDLVAAGHKALAIRCDVTRAEEVKTPWTKPPFDSGRLTSPSIMPVSNSPS